MITPKSQGEPPRPDCRLFQCSLRTHLLFAVLLALVVVWFAKWFVSEWELARSQQQAAEEPAAREAIRSAAAAIRKAGGHCDFDGVYFVWFDEKASVTDDDLAHLKVLPWLAHLSLADTGITDAGLEHLKGLSGLESLDLSGTKVTGAGLEHLKRLPRLRTVVLRRTSVTDADLDKFRSYFGIDK